MQTSISLKVAELVKALLPTVEAAVVDALVKREVDKRSSAIVITMDRLAKLEHEFYRLGPDIITYDDLGKKVTESFSKARIDERTKATQRITKLENALTKAIEKADYGDLYNLANAKDES